ncbi:MAG TPA: hypothetical protein VEA18_00480 [Candidatus Kapabacteria bacterium]|nr:hypothetical protein [Candidatus Kapabacteria bacterium]
MKWYKKQMDQLKEQKKVPTGPKSKTPGTSFDGKKNIALRAPNPVAAMNRNRPKTDSK